MEEMQANPSAHRKLLKLFYHPSTAATEEFTEQVKENLERCRRIEEKRERINYEIDENLRVYLQARGFEVMDPAEIVDWSIDEEVVKREFIEKLDNARNRLRKLGLEKRKKKEEEVGSDHSEKNVADVSKGVETLQL
jgi:hypothetical protein